MIYFISAVGTDLVKVGYCAADPFRRLRELQTGSGHELALLAVFRGEPCDERFVHQRLARYRERGEWFRVPESILQMCDAASAVMLIGDNDQYLNDLMDEVNEILAYHEVGFVACAAGA